jgi:hypothetical protein
MTQPRSPEDNALEDAFSELRTMPPDVPDALMDRVMADAIAQMPRSKRRPVWQNVLRTLGGWPAVAGLAATACVGVWMGGVLTDDLIVAFGLADSASLEMGRDLGAFDLLLLDG